MRRTLLAVAALALTGCGATGPSHNAVDVAFATRMISHHAESLALVEMSRGRPVSTPFRQLAEAVDTSQRAETMTMSGWLKAWHKPVPPTGIGASGTANSDTTTTGALPGQMDTDDLKSLQRRRGADFQRAWLVMMRDHQDDAVTLAGQELADGKDPQVLALARRIRTTGTAQVKEIQRLLAG